MFKLELHIAKAEIKFNDKLQIIIKLVIHFSRIKCKASELSDGAVI